ncbi:hypothetical protein [uncultured Tateyamaria sp.]|uniref:hypothetical protein n=1 Tax=uncultured Tateyamaria sp. TaxID=455651 RepID=UPI002602D526|nr:hypothetical protein [uncultured Tateyamaria sp.]
MSKRKTSWTLTSHETAAFENLRTRLGFTNKEFCHFAKSNVAVFSLITNGKRPLSEDLCEKLDVFLSHKRDALPDLSETEFEEISIAIKSFLRRGPNNNLDNYVYHPPGSYLPIGALNYVERYSDILVERELIGHGEAHSEHSMLKSVYVVGGAGSGKTSLLKRIVPIAQNMGRQPIVGRMADFFDGGEWPSKKLSKQEIWNACGYALSGGEEEFRTNDLDPEKRSFNRSFRRLLHRHLMKKPRAIRIVEDFYELSLNSENIEDVCDLLFTLFDRQERKDDNLIFVSDDGLAGSIQGVSDYVTRGAFIECGHVDTISLNKLVNVVLGDHPSEKLVWNVLEAIEIMRDAFGCCLLLHHAALHKVRQIPKEQYGHYATVSALDEAIEAILDELEGSKNVTSSKCKHDDELGKFADSVSRRLALLEHHEGSDTLMSDLASGSLSVGVSFRARRFLEWSGYVERGGGVPEYVQRLCKRATAK